MAVEIRPCAGPDEFLAAAAPILHYFGRTPLPDMAGRFERVLPPERMHAAYEDGSVVGGAGAFPLSLTVPGGRLPCAGVSLVAVLPTHRRRGLMNRLMRAQLDDVHARGEPLAALWASEGTIYGRYGYGLASLCGELELPRERVGFHVPVEPGRLRLVETAEALAAFPAVYDRVAAETPGMFSRSAAWWEDRALADPEWRRQGGGELMRVLLEEDGRPAAYALYRLHPSFERGVPAGFTSVIEAVGATPSATAAIWRFLFDVDWMIRVRARLLPLDHPLFLLLAEPQWMRFTVGDALWLRLVDVEAALSGRSYAGEGAVVLEVADPFCPWNEGRWLLEGGGVSRTREAADIRLGVEALGSAYLGGFSFARLARAGRIEELRPGAAGRADGLVRSDRAPWCPEVF